MSGSGAEVQRRTLAMLSLVLVAPLTACSNDEPQQSAAASSPPPTSSASAVEPAPKQSPTPTASGVVTAPRNVLADIEDALRERAAALTTQNGGDAFDDTIARGDPDFVANQRQYWSNMVQLPVAEATYLLDPASVVRTGSSYQAVVDLHLQLTGFDTQPALSRSRMRFVRSPTGVRVAAPRPGDEFVEGAQPWDLGPIQARRQADVLGIFDSGSVGRAPSLMESVSRGVADVRPRLPSASLADGVVFYALSDAQFIGSLEDEVDSVPTTSDGLTFTVPGVGPGPAASRFVLSPSVLGNTTPGLTRLIRHELTHVATGPLGPAVPLWLSEGVAEWVSVQAMEPEARALSGPAIEAAQRGLSGLPADENFSGDRSEANYGISWWAVEFLARTYGKTTPWQLIEEFQRVGSDMGRTELLRALGIGPQRIALGAEELILKKYVEPVEPATEASAPPIVGPSSESVP